MTLIQIKGWETAGIEASIEVTEESDWELVKEIVAKCRYKHEMMQQIEEGDGDVRPWSEVKEELFEVVEPGQDVEDGGETGDE